MKINQFNCIFILNILNFNYGIELYTFVSSHSDKLKYLNILYAEIKKRQQYLESQITHFMNEREEFYRQQKIEHDKFFVERKKLARQQQELEVEMAEFRNYLNTACDDQLYKNMEPEAIAALLDDLMPFSDCVTIYNVLDIEKKAKVLNYMKNLAKKRALTYNALKLKKKVEKKYGQNQL